MCKKKKRVTTMFYLVPTMSAPLTRFEDETYYWLDDARAPMAPPPGFGPGAPGGAPATPPPAFVPQLPAGVGGPTPYGAPGGPGGPGFHGGPGGPGGPGGFHFGRPPIRPCLFKFTYIWLNNGRAFWFYPTYVDQFRVSGFRWTRRFGWRPDTLFRNSILWAQCY